MRLIRILLALMLGVFLAAPLAGCEPDDDDDSASDDDDSAGDDDDSAS